MKLHFETFSKVSLLKTVLIHGFVLIIYLQVEWKNWIEQKLNLSFSYKQLQMIETQSMLHQVR